MLKFKSVLSCSADDTSSSNLDVFVIRSDADVKLTFEELVARFCSSSRFESAAVSRSNALFLVSLSCNSDCMYSSNALLLFPPSLNKGGL